MNLSTRYILLTVLPLLLAVGGAGCSAEAKKARRLEQANRHFEAGAYDNAEIEYRNVLQLEPLHPKAIARLGVIYSHQGRLGRVFPFLTKARELAPEDLEVRLRLATILAGAGRMAEAREEVLHILEHDPQNAEAPMLLAEIAVEPQDIQETRRLLRSSPAAERAPVQVALGLLELRERRFAEAEAIFERAQALDPKSSAAVYALGTMYWAQNDLVRAEEALAAAARLSPPRSAKRIRYAQFSRTTGKVDNAKRVLEEITEEAPDYLPAWLMLADIAGSERRFDDSLAAVGRVLARDSAHPEALLLSARIRLIQGEKAKAVEELERAARLYPKSAPIHHQLGLAYVANSELAKAATSLGQTVSLAPGSPGPTMALAEVNLRQGNPAAAIVVLRQLVQQEPSNEQARLLLAHAFRAQGNLDEAIAVYRQMNEAFPPNPQVSLLTGLVLLQQEKRDEARAAFNRALEISQDFLPAVEQLVNLELEANDHAAALSRTEAQVARNPNSAGALLLKAKILLRQSNSEEATSTLKKVIELQPELPLPYFLLARIYLSANEHEKALANLQQAATANPRNVEAWMMIGVIHDQSKNYAAARESYEKAIAINPRFSAALNNLAYLYSEHFNELDKAFEMAQRARELLPGEPHTADTLGWILHKRGQYPWALTLLAESAEKLPASPDVQFHLGMTHFMMGEEQPARAALERALNLSQDFQGAEAARRSLAILSIDPSKADAETRARLERDAASEPDPVTLARLAAIYRHDGATAKAVATYEAALAAGPNYTTAALDLIKLYREQRESAKALELARATRRLSPSDPTVAHVVGQLAFEAGDQTWGVSLLQEAARRQPTNPDVQYDFARASYSFGRVATAEAAMRTALESNPLFARAAKARTFLELTGAASGQAPATEVAAKIEQALTEDPHDLPALMAKGLLSEAQGNPAEARGAYEAALARHPEFSPARRQLVLLLAKTPIDDAKAAELSVKAREAYPDDAELAKAIGIVMFRQGNFPRAASLLQESSRRRATDAELMFYLGMAQQQLKDQAASVRSLRRALELELQPDLAAEAKRILAGSG